MDSLRKNKLAIFLFMFPAAALFLMIIIIPIFMSLYYSVLDYNIAESTFVGIENYKELFTNANIRFPKAVGNAMLLAVLSVFIQLPISLGLALLLAKGIKGERFFLGMFFLPVLLSTVVVGQLWKKMYFPTYGILNVMLESVGLDNLARNWLGDPGVVLIAVFIPLLWQYVGYHMLLMYAGIKTIAPELKEAAKIDGATDGQVSRLIVIPMLKPIIRISLIFAVTGSLKAFDLIYVLTGGGPLRASQVPATLMVEQAFDRYRFGLGSSIAISIIFLCFLFAIIIKASIRTEEM
ncbi:sugar ABC transporter permease [Herbivorax sp. ANBcel31]|uniref:carbohydrate ABC transporter permease n=1 Tax=Herbivorax sp. ANBcel31 TaxID=3069754 RepID=UPI0027B6C93B|nr:sugar ABC transporter permease [Herbivorax sp. ANBcel31]MDQ2086060.1 sugar ABC transporter permease [Herbivorax sp. ANBcel31]